jgi:hypothetical protein
MALKVQFEDFRSAGLLVNATPAFNANPSAHALSVALDFVF